jgi:hypothetical protein
MKPDFQPKVRKDITFGTKPVDPLCQCHICRGKIQFQAPSELIDAFIEGKVALFVGAGVSSEGPDVQRDNFYDQINYILGNKGDPPPFPDLMEQFCDSPGGRSALIERIQAYFHYIYSHREIYDKATRFHRQLATFFPLDTIITTNWDTYFEDECGATAFVSDSDIPLWDAAKRKVLKIHGTIANFGSIVATRSDYRKCARRLNSGVLGKLLTSLLATRTVVFIGYSLRDDDFLQIYNAMRKQLADFHRQAYFVAPLINDDDRTRLESMGLRLIQTDGEFFVAQLKEHAQTVRCICADDMYSDVARLLAAVILTNNWLRDTFNIKRHPQYLISSWYLDGLQHGLERILRLRKTGEYSDLHRLIRQAQSYYEFLRRYLRDKKFDDAAYCAGYSTAMIFASQKSDEREWPPLFYYFGGYCVDSRSAYKRVINKLPNLYKAPNRFLKKMAAEYPNMILVHMAQLNLGKYLDELDAKNEAKKG